MLWTFATYDHPGDDSSYLAWLRGHPDGFVVVSERKPRPAYVVLHRATCTAVGGDAPYPKELGDSYLRVCGARDVLEEYFADSEVRSCPFCL